MNRLALVLLASCAQSLSMAPAASFTPSERAEIQRAADAWNARTTKDKRITVDDAGRWRILKAVPPHSYNGECHSGLRIIWIHPEHPGATVYDVALHEMGHAVGLGHTTTGVMMPFTVSAEFTPEVLEECRQAGACR
jgi:hypothetical protein